MWKSTLIFALLALLWGSTPLMQAQNNPDSQIVDGSFDSTTLERVYQYKIYLPAGYDDGDNVYPVVYLLHGRGDTMSGWLNIRSTLDELIASGELPPMIAVMPDMPSSARASYYIDSAYEGMLYRAEAVETAFFADLIPHIDSTYRTIADRRSRVVGGYSMGGYGAIRYVLAHPDQFMGALILSPAVYTPLPPEDSSTREFGAFGDEVSLFNEEIYTRLNYPAILEDFSGEYRLNLFIAVGDDEWKHPDPVDMEHDLDFESHRFFNRVARVSGIASEFRVYDGGHDWDVWQPGFIEGMRYLANYLNTEPPEETSSASGPTGWQTGTSGNDLAGGIASGPDGSIYQAVAVEGALNGQTHRGGLDMAIIKYGPDRAIEWLRQLGTSGNDRPYGLILTPQQEVIVVGYTQGSFEGADAAGGDDIVVFKLDASGELLWTTQFGTPEADRGYAIAPGPDGSILISGYTKGELSGANAGDKDIITAMLDENGAVQWIAQLGGDGEDKGQALAVASDGSIYSAGMTSSALTDDAAGGIDGFIQALNPNGEQISLIQFGTSEWDEVTGIAAHGEHVAATGFSAGDLAGTLSGDKDIVTMLFDSGLNQIAADQIGSNLNDKGAAVTFRDDGSFIVAAYSDGGIAGSIGDFDLVLLAYSSAGERQNTWQLGTVERDGTDEWAEKNLFIAPYEGGVVVSGLTLGAFGEEGSHGGSDAFILLPDTEADS